MRVEGQIWMLQEMELLWESGTQTVEEHDEKIKGRGGGFRGGEKRQGWWREQTQKSVISNEANTS